MNKKIISVSQVLKQAKEALEGGKKHEARYWAQIAASMEPNMEEPWLTLLRLLILALASPTSNER